jgi:Lectin C-type domain
MGTRTIRQSIMLQSIMLQFLSLMLIALGLFGTQTAGAAVLDTLHYNGHTYYLISENNWEGAAAEALSLGGYLATINDQGEQDFLWNHWKDSLGAGEGLWIGLERSGHHGQNIFVWMNGEPVNFWYWATNAVGTEPNNGFGRYEEDYVAMDSRFTPPGAWADLPNQGTDWMADRGIVEVNTPAPIAIEISTPEVSTLLLLGSGLTGLVLRRRRARAASNGDAAVEASQESNSTPVA